MQIERYEGLSETTAPPVEVVESAGGKKTLIGYAIVWGAVSSMRADGFRHRFERGSIIWEPVVNALWSHSLAHPLGSTANETLRMSEDDYGQRVEIDIDTETTTGRDVYRYVETRLVRGMSFSGVILDKAATSDPRTLLVRRFSGREVTVTILPAMEQTTIVTAEQSAQLEKEKHTREMNRKLNSYKLAIYRPGKVSVK